MIVDEANLETVSYRNIYMSLDHIILSVERLYFARITPCVPDMLCGYACWLIRHLDDILNW